MLNRLREACLMMAIFIHRGIFMDTFLGIKLNTLLRALFADPVVSPLQLRKIFRISQFQKTVDQLFRRLLTNRRKEPSKSNDLWPVPNLIKI